MTYQFNIQLIDINNPEVWRQIAIPAHYTFRQFHEITQAAFDWDNSDFYEFIDVPQRVAAKLKIGQAARITGGLEGHMVTLSDVFKQTRTFYYFYNMEDGWIHKISLEKTSDETIAHAVCLSGEGACPPENCGGAAGLEHLKLVMADPSHTEYELMRVSHKLLGGEDFEFFRFDIDAANRRMETAGRPFRNYLLAEHTIDDHKYGLNRELWRRVDDINIRFSKGNYNMVHELKELVLKYPGIPHFKNMLSLVFLMKKEYDQFIKLAQENLRDFPEYLLSRSNLAAHYAHIGELDKSLELLGKDFDLNSLYPERNGRFAETEIYKYHLVVFRYLFIIGDDIETRHHLDLLEQYCLEKSMEDQLFSQYMQLRLSKLKRGYKRTVEVIPAYIAPSDQAPVFTHPEIEQLYAADYLINRDILRQIVELPRESLIRDLEKVLIDSIARFNQFKNMDWIGTTHSFPQHALYILSALEAEEALETVIILLSQNDEYLKYWFGDLVTEEFFHFIYCMGQNRIDRLEEFILAPNRDTFIRTAISDVLLQIALQQPDRRQEMIDRFERILKCMLQHTDDENTFDSLAFSSIVSDFAHIADRRYQPLIEECFATGLIDETAIGTLKGIKLKLYKKARKSATRIIPDSIEQFYANWAKWFAPRDRNDAGSNKNVDHPKLPSRKADAAKVGRNDPCLCGSGKKYKKCCGAN